MAGYLGESIETSSYWNGLFMLHGVSMLCPFLDSRMVRFGLNLKTEDKYKIGNPKNVLKRRLALHVPRSLIDRPKRGFGQPIFEWLSPGGHLRPAVEEIGDYRSSTRRLSHAPRPSLTGFCIT